jgi:hypothetical protein
MVLARETETLDPAMRKGGIQPNLVAECHEFTCEIEYVEAAGSGNANPKTII